MYNRDAFVIRILSVLAVCCLVAGCSLVILPQYEAYEEEELLENVTHEDSSPLVEHFDVDAALSELGIEKPTPSEEASTEATEPTEGTTEIIDPIVEPEPEPEPEPQIELVENPYRDYFLSNSDCKAYLVIPDTNVDYPVMWTPEDEEYYLRRGFDKKSNKAGCLLLDTDSCLDPLTTNLIIHGHNMKAGTMFGKLSSYEDQTFCDEHSTMYLYTENTLYEYRVISVFRSQVFRKSDTCFKFYKFFQADTEEEFRNFYDNIMDMSIVDTPVTAEYGDHFLTLSTCSYHVDNGRFVVVAKQVNAEECFLPLQ